MIDSAASGGDGRRRGKKSRGKHGRRKRPPRPRGPRPPQQEWYAPDSQRDDSSILGSRPLRPRDRDRDRDRDRRYPQNNGPPDEFALFCAYHLGITQDDGYAEPRTDEVARRFGVSNEGLHELLRSMQLDDETMRRTDFDLESAQLDIRLAPEGISRTESARDFYEEFVQLRSSAN